MYKGFFVTMEGIDGTGKTTQLRHLTERLTTVGANVLVVKEPGDVVDGKYVGSEIGGKIRDILFRDPTTKVLDKEVTDLLFLADHIQLWRRTIIPALEQGRVVLSDRYADSQFAYGIAKGSTAWIQGLYKQQYGPVPNVTVLLLGEPEFLAPRTKRTGTVDEGKQDGKKWAGIDSQRIVKEAYELQLSSNPNVITVYVTEVKGIDNVANEIWDQLRPRYTEHLRQQSEEQFELFPDGVTATP